MSSDRILDYISELRFSEISSEVIHQGKRCFLDTLGAMIAGAETPVAHLMTDLATTQFSGSQCTILVHNRQASAVGAALANGFAANALDIDDGFRLVKGHPGACVLPVLLAAGEIAANPLDGKELLTTLIIGYEVAIRAGLIRHATYRTYHSSGSWGAIGGAAAAGRILGLNRSKLCEAMGAAEYHAPIAPMMKGIEKPSMGKDSIGWGAMVAMACTLMAQQGFTGIQPLFDEAPDPQWIDDLGKDYMFMKLYFKPYAACRWAQPAVAGALKVVRSNDVAMESIASIRVRTFSAAAALSCAHPASTEDAQYNLAFPVAAALLDGEVGPTQVLPPRIFDATLLSLADKVQVEVDEEFEKAFPQKTFAEVVVTTHDNKTISSGPMEPQWEPPDTLPSDEELETKFHHLTAPVLGDQRSRKLSSLIWDLENTLSLDQIIGLCEPHN